MSEDTIAEMMRDYAEAAVELARDFHVNLDYSEGSLEALEQILAQLHDDYRAFRATTSNRAYASEIGWEEIKDQSSPAKDDSYMAIHAEAAKPAVQENTAQVEEQMVMMCKLWGGYLGEVVRRRWGGEWGMETYPGADFATLTLNVRGAKLFPSMKIYRRLSEGEQDNVWSFDQRVKEKLG